MICCAFPVVKFLTDLGDFPPVISWVSLIMDDKNFEKLEHLIQTEVDSGELSSDKKRLQEIKLLCKSSDDLVRKAFHLLMKHLERRHSQVRWSCFLLVSELFDRSHIFRELLIANLNDYLVLVAEVDLLQPLPLPKQVAQRLKQQSTLKLKFWFTKYGETYKKLSLAFKLLTETQKIKIPSDDHRDRGRINESGGSEVSGSVSLIENGQCFL